MKQGTDYILRIALNSFDDRVTVTSATACSLANCYAGKDGYSFLLVKNRV